MRVLITGAGGFLGSHLAEFLLSRGWTVYGTIHRDSRNVTHLKNRLVLLRCNIQKREQVQAAVEKVEPEVIFHLAAQSLPILSWKDPEGTFEANVFGTLYLLEAVRNAGLSPTIVVACSSAEYGFSASDEIPIKEAKALHAATPYGISKVAADLLCHLYWATYGMSVVRVRPFFIVGPRKVGDVCSDFARGIVAMERGYHEVLGVGNLEPVRDFLDVDDAVRALWLLAEKGSPGEVYNLCSGRGYKVREILDLLVAMAHKPIPIREDPQGFRVADESVIVGDNSKLRALGWEPSVPLQQSLVRILSSWRRAEDDS